MSRLRAGRSRSCWSSEGRGLLPALSVARVGHGARRPCAARGGGEAGARAARAALDWLGAAPDARCAGRLGRAAPRCRPGGWAFQYANPHYPDLMTPRWWRWRWTARMRRRDQASTRRFAAIAGRANGSRDCRAATAHGPPSTPTTLITISITSRSPTMARCSIRRLPTSPRAASQCSLSSGETPRHAARSRAGLRWLEAAQETDGSWFGRSSKKTERSETSRFQGVFDDHVG